MGARHESHRRAASTMINDEGTQVDLYIPRKCSATNRLIHAKDRASVQINVGHADQNGVYTGEFTTFAMCGFVRAQGESDQHLDRHRQGGERQHLSAIRKAPSVESIVGCAW